MAAHSIATQPFPVPETVQLILPPPPPTGVRGVAYVMPVVQIGTLELGTLEEMIQDWTASLMGIWREQRNIED